jgi:phenylacetate-CoA ligase
MLSAGVYPEEIRNLEDVQKLPLLSKDELAENLHYGMFDKNTKWQTLHKVVTSGSTGRPSTTYAEQVQLEVRHGTTLRSVEWTGWKVGDRQMRLWHQTLGMSLSQITRERLDSLLMRRKFIPAFELTELSLQNLVEKIRKFRPVLLDGYAESLNFLATFANSGRPILNGPRFVISSAQVLTAQTRSEIEKSTGAKVFDKYGAREFSGIAYECMEGTRHVMAESYIVELLKDGKPARVGEVGEVIITDLNNFAVPMLRFRIGDLVTQVEQKTCGCGRNMMSIGEIQGRTQALVHCSNGRWIPGTFFAHFFKEHEDQVRFFQVVQERRGSFTLSIVKNDDFLEASWSKTLNELRDFVGDTEVRVDFVDEIPLLRTGKRTPVVSHVKVDFQSV